MIEIIVGTKGIDGIEGKDASVGRKMLSLAYELCGLNAQ